MRARVLELCFVWVKVSRPQSTLGRNKSKNGTFEEAGLGFNELLHTVISKFSLILFFIIRTIYCSKLRERSMPRDYGSLHMVELNVEG